MPCTSVADFPETHAQTLSANQPCLRSIRTAAEAGMPVYAECGGLMLLSRVSFVEGRPIRDGTCFRFDVEVFDTAQGHGYLRVAGGHAESIFPGRNHASRA